MAAYAAAVSLNRVFWVILNHYDVLLPPPVLKTYEFAYKELKSFQKFMERLDSGSRKRMNASLARIADEIRRYEEEDYALVDLIPSEAEAVDFDRGIHFLVEKLKKVEEEYYSLPSSSSGVVPKSKMVGLYDHRSQLKDLLMSQWMDDYVFLVVGMAGIGKTTLAREVFEDLDVSEWFDCRAWVSVGFEWRYEEIWEAILAQVDPEARKEVVGGNGEEIGEALKRSLKGRRYLIVLDDAWHKEVYEYLRSLLLDDQNRSRILLTTRMKYIAVNDSISCYPYDMRLMDKKESWDLLRLKVFGGNSCPPHLEKVGEKIAEKCDGLPLTIVTIADPLSKADESVWFDVAVKKKHRLFIDAYDQISQVLYPSYEILNDETKLCFLYMGAFPQKYKIPKSKLINLWTVEEFLKPKFDHTLETWAVEELRFLQLIAMIMVHQISSVSSSKSLYSVHVKTCGLHSSWWHFCQIEARKTNCFHVLDCYSKDDLEESIKGQSRLSIHNNVLFALKHVHNSIEEICASTAHSLLCLGPYNQYMVPICFGLKFLQRLDALNVRFYDFPLEVLELVMLRYLALTCNRQLPPSISKLKKLQYLIVHPHQSIKLCGALSNLPTEIWDMNTLEHLQVMRYDPPDLGDIFLENLITLLDVTTGSCTVLHRIPNLKTLGIRIELEPVASEPLSCFDHISHLSKLETLKCVIVNPKWKYEVASLISPFPCLPFSLTKLSLSGLGYPWEEMSKISSLPNLKILKLRCDAFRGPEWNVEENAFPNVSSLLFEGFDLLNLNWARGSFKSLEILKIKHCYKVKEMYMGNLPHIEEIEVVDCGPLVEWYVKYNALEYFQVSRIFVHSSWKS